MIDAEKLNNSLTFLRAITHPIRISILSFIDKNRIVNVNKIYNKLKLDQSITSQHLRILRDSNLVHTRRDGKFIFYSVNYDKIDGIVNNTHAFFQEK